MPFLAVTANITEYPSEPRRYPDETIISKGDLHANPLNALHFLLQEGFVTLSKEDFDAFVTCYKKFSVERDPMLTEAERYETLMEMSGIIQKIQKAPGSSVAQFLGDTIGDRGENDLTMLQLYQRLDELDVKFEILYSNHDAFFIDGFYAAVAQKKGIPAYMSAQDFSINPHQFLQFRSVYNLFTLCIYAFTEHKTPLLVEIRNILKMHYFPHLKIISCNPSENFTKITTHAPTRFESIEILASMLREHSNRPEVLYDDTTPEALVLSCERINTAMREILQAYITTDEPIDEAWLNVNQKPTHALHDFIWERYLANQNEPPPDVLHDHSLIFQHGHTDFSYYANSVSLDSTLGKVNTVTYDSGDYRISSSKAPITPSLHPQKPLMLKLYPSDHTETDSPPRKKRKKRRKKIKPSD